MNECDCDTRDPLATTFSNVLRAVSRSERRQYTCQAPSYDNDAYETHAAFITSPDFHNRHFYRYV